MQILNHFVVEIIGKLFPKLFFLPQAVKRGGVRVRIIAGTETVINTEAVQEDQAGEQIHKYKESSDPCSGKDGHGSAEEKR